MKNLIVVDDFYQDPLRVREHALRCNYSDVRAFNYPGFQSEDCFPANAIKTAFERLIGERLQIDEKSSTFGRFRLMYAHTASRLTIHTDSQSDWTAIVYLNLPDQCQGGTAFYRHRATGMVGLEAGYQSASSWKQIEDLEAQTVGKDTQNMEAWDVISLVSMRFNRLVLFRGFQFHSHTCSWGDAPENGRLTQNFFFNSSVCSDGSTDSEVCT